MTIPQNRFAYKLFRSSTFTYLQVHFSYLSWKYPHRWYTGACRYCFGEPEANENEYEWDVSLSFLCMRVL